MDFYLIVLISIKILVIVIKKMLIFILKITIVLLIVHFSSYDISTTWTFFFHFKPFL